MHALIENGAVKQYPYGLGQLKAANPNTSFPASMSDEAFEAFGVYRVFFSTPPVYDDKTQTLEENTPVFDVDALRWTQVWAVRDLTAEEVQAKSDAQAASIRSERNTKLAECDWVVIKALEGNQPLSFDWANYRQALRDITTQAGFPLEVTWPIKP